MDNYKTIIKDSPLGKIPNDWEVKTLGELCKVFVGRDLKESNFSTTKNDKYKHPVFSNTVQDEGLYGYYDIEEYSGESLTIVGRGAGLGKAFTRKGSFGAIGRLLVLFPFENVNAHYITEYVNNKLNIHQESGGIPQLTGKQIAGYKIAIPNYQEQNVIAHILSLMDTAINKNNQIIAQKELKKKWLMQRLLNEKIIVKNEKWCKSGVRVVELGKLGRIVSGGTPSTVNEMYWNGEINWITPTDITALKGSKYLFKTSRTISEEGLKNSSAELIPENSIVITTRATIGELAINKIPVATNQGFKSIVPDNKMVNTEYLFYLLQTKKDQLKSFGNGSTFFEVSKSDIFHFLLFIVNSLEEQTSIAQVLQAADKEIQLLKTKTEKLRDQKKGLMQQLLTGKKRLAII